MSISVRSATYARLFSSISVLGGQGGRFGGFGSIVVGGEGLGGWTGLWGDCRPDLDHKNDDNNSLILTYKQKNGAV